MKRLLTATALLEIAAGAGALCAPSFAVEILLGSPLAAPGAVVVTRVTGAALMTIGFACWAARTEPKSRSATGIAQAMIFYNCVVVSLLLYAGLGLKLSGVGLWPAIVVHVLLAGWCVATVRKP